MAAKIEYLAGQRMVGTILCFEEEIERTNPKERRAIFKCDCGNKLQANIAWVRNLNTTSCGCVRVKAITAKNTTHTQAPRNKASGAYRSWQAMHQRAGKVKNYLHVRVCKRWETFEGFYTDMGDRPEGMSIERLNSLGDYEPNNCVWATAKQQAQNTSQTKLITINGETHSIQEWCRIKNIGYQIVKQRRRRGMSIEDSISTPLNESKRGKKRGHK